MIDWERVRGLAEDQGEVEFLQQIDQELTLIERIIMRLCVEPPDRQAADLHLLACRAFDLGFAGLARLCHQIGAQAGCGPVAIADLAALQACHAESRAEFLGKARIWCEAAPGI